MNLSGKNVLVIGGAGFIGSHVVEELLATDVSGVTIYDNFVRSSAANLAVSLRDKRCTIFGDGGDIRDTDVLDKAVSDADAVIHLAAMWLLHCRDYPKTAFEVNIGGTFNVLEACVRHEVEKLVYSSSASVYGDAVAVPMTEDHPFLNRNFYGATKIAGEAMCRAFHDRYGMDYVGLRYMNVYGPRQDYHGAYIAVIMKMLDAIDQGESPTIMGDGSEAFDFVAVEDCGKANVCAMKADATDRFYNVGTGKRTSLKELAEMLVELTGCAKPIRYAPRSQATLVRNRIGCPKLASKEIKFTGGIDLMDGLQRLIDWRSRHKAEVEARRRAVGLPA